MVPLRRPWLRAAAVALPLAAGIALFFLFPRAEDPRLKGLTSVELVSAQGQPLSKASPGERVTLFVGGAGHTHAAVLAVDALGEVTQVWPAGTEASPIPRGARAKLEPPFEVTPGSVVLFAFFTDSATPVAPMRAALERQLEEELRAGRSPLDVKAPASDGAVARVRLEVAR